jgi:hypothetical protein
MGIAVSLIVVAVGAILAFAVNPSGDPAIDPNAAGWILMIVGLIGLILDILLWESWGPRYMRRRHVAYETGYPTRPPSTAPRRTTVVEDEVVDPRAGPPPP